MKNPEEVTVESIDVKMYLQRGAQDYYIETAIENYTGLPIFLYHPSGIPEQIPPTLVGPNTLKGVVVTVHRRCGRGKPMSKYDNGRGNPEFCSDLRAVRVFVPARCLQARPVYIQEISSSISFENNLEFIRTVNCADSEYIAELTRDISQNYFDKGYPSPLLINCNIHNLNVDTLTVAINGELMDVQPMHNFTATEYIEISVQRGFDRIVTQIDHDEVNWSDTKSFEVKIFDQIWIFGTDRAAVQRKVTERRLALSKTFTEAEFNEKIELKTKDVKQELASNQRDLALANDEIKALKQKLKQTSEELADANSYSRQTYEQRSMSEKYAQECLKRETAGIENETLREKMRLEAENNRIKLEADKAKLEAERKISELKVEKEIASKSKTDADTTLTILKVAAAAIPIIVSIGTWVYKSGKVVASHAGPIGAAISAGLTVCESVAKAGKWLWKKFF